MQEATLRDTLKFACKSSIEEATMHAQLIESQLVYLEHLGDLPDGGSVLYEQARRVRTQVYCVSLIFLCFLFTSHYPVLEICYSITKMNSRI